MSKANQMIFDTDTNKDALQLAQKFIASLLQHNIESMDDYADIHIYQEETLIIVEWTQIFYDDDFPQNRFVLLDDEHALIKELIMPDNSILCIFEHEDEQAAIDRWHKDNPGWIKKDNTWINTMEDKHENKVFLCE